MHDPNPFPFTEYVATMRVNSLGEGNSEFEWSAEFKVQGMADENLPCRRYPGEAADRSKRAVRVSPTSAG
jgi:hypothetical protein